MDISAETVSKALLASWIARFGSPKEVTFDQGRQFECSLLRELFKLTSTRHIRTTPYHPQSNRIIERWHSTLKSSILEVGLPLILLSLRNAFKPDLQTSPAEMVCGSQLRMPGDFFTEGKDCDSPHQFLTTLRDVIGLQTAQHSTPSIQRSKIVISSS